MDEAPVGNDDRRADSRDAQKYRGIKGDLVILSFRGQPAGTDEQGNGSQHLVEGSSQHPECGQDPGKAEDREDGDGDDGREVDVLESWPELSQHIGAVKPHEPHPQMDQSKANDRKNDAGESYGARLGDADMGEKIGHSTGENKPRPLLKGCRIALKAAEGRDSDDQGQHPRDHLQQHGTASHRERIRLFLDHPGCSRAAHQRMPPRDRAAHEGHEHQRPERFSGPDETRVCREIAKGWMSDEDPQRCAYHAEKDHPKPQVVDGLGPAPDGQGSPKVAEGQDEQDPYEFCLGDRAEEKRRWLTPADRPEKALDWPQAGEKEDTDEDHDHGDHGGGKDTHFPPIDHLAEQKTHCDPDENT